MAYCEKANLSVKMMYACVYMQHVFTYACMCVHVCVHASFIQWRIGWRKGGGEEEST